MAREFSQKLKELSKKIEENGEQMKEVERKLKQIRYGSVATDSNNHQHQHQHHSSNHTATTKTTDNQKSGNGSKDELPIFKVLFVKCPLENCLEFALTVDGIKNHLFSEHGIISSNQCIATERCVRQQVHFRTYHLLQGHIKEEHLNANGFNYFECYKCGPKSSTKFNDYESLGEHFYSCHIEGHFACTRCKDRRDPSTGCLQYAFSAKYADEVVQHFNEVHKQND
ncbi:hypothetical protein TYRP_005478 [Tyrophagus putrescentiae]|nr:hypothetical protein TYRP_005478 [Tyrophagus putrescentiae]